MIQTAASATSVGREITLSCLLALTLTSVDSLPGLVPQAAMVLGIDKNVYVEPTIWTIEWAREFYGYPVTRSN